jgi:HEAT repeat protein
MIVRTETLASLVTAGSLWLAATMALLMGLLILRRLAGERVAAAREANSVKVSRELLRAISGATQPSLPTFDAARPEERLRALSHLFHLLRGGDRDRLLALAEAYGLFDTALLRVTRGRAARRIDAMRVLEQFASPTCVAGLQQALERDQNAEVRLEAAATLARMGQLPAIEKSIRLLRLDQSPRTRIHSALFRSLAQRDWPAMAQLADNPEYGSLRADLVDALGSSGDFAVLPALAGHGEDSAPEVRNAALRAARRLGHPGAGTWATQLLYDPVESVRIQAVRTCGALGVRAAAPRLREMVDDPSWWVRTRAADALTQLASPATA